MRAVIIDDEQHCITTLKWSLQQYCHDIEVVGVANNGETGFLLIKETHPDLVFLDIEMPILSGIDMLLKLDEIDFKVIFTTAYDKYAVKAIKLNALDFLLKPIDKDELVTSIGKAKKEMNSITKKQVEHLSETHKTKIVDKIALSLGNGEGGEIIMCDGTSISLSRSKKEEFMEFWNKL
jgi:two-component system LytT family response regulator